MNAKSILFAIAALSLILVQKAEAQVSREERLIRLGERKFGAPSPAETKLYRAVANDTVADYRSVVATDNDPARARGWDSSRVLKANRLAWLCIDPEAAELISSKGIQIAGARIEGKLDLSYAKVPFPLLCSYSAFRDSIYMPWADIQALGFTGSHTKSIFAPYIRVENSFLLNYGFRAEGKVTLDGAKIGHTLHCRDGQFIYPAGAALSAQGIQAYRIVLAGDFKADGGADLAGGVIGFIFQADGQFINPDGYAALRLDGTRVGGNVHLDRGFRGEGMVTLLGAHIDGSVWFSRGEFINPDGTALNLQDLKVGNSVSFSQSITDGQVSMKGADIQGGLFLANMKSPEKLSLDLSSAKVGTLQDDMESWPPAGNLRMHGFTYDALQNSPASAETRLRWLRLQPREAFSFQPYEQFAAVLRKDGRQEEAIKILIAKEEDRANRTELTLAEWSWFYIGKLIGYGHRPLRAAIIGLVLLVLGGALFEFGRGNGLITSCREGEFFRERIDQDYPKFNAIIFSLDLFAPLIDLKQDNYWLPNPNCGRELLEWKGFKLRTGGLLRAYMWTHILLGWLLTTLLFAGLTGLVKG